VINRTAILILSSLLAAAFAACGGDEPSGVDTSEPDTADTTETDATDPDIEEHDTDEPQTGDPDTDELDTSEPDTDEPDTDEPDTDDPDTSDVEDDVPIRDDCSDIPILGPQAPGVDATCANCINRRCCEERYDCSLDAQCTELRECYEACDAESDCEDACTSTIGIPPVNTAFVTCRNSTCGAECAETACIGNVEWPAPSVAEYERELRFVDFLSGNPVVGASIMLCDKVTDLECEMPIAEEVTDSEGAVTLTLPSTVDGISVFIALDADGYLGSDFWFIATDPETYLTEGNMSWNVVSQNTANLMGNILDLTFDENRGIVTYLATDCGRRGTSGLVVAVDTADDETTSFYIEGSFPDADRPRTARGGSGAFVNLPPGDTLLTYFGPDNVLWGETRVNLRANRVIGTNLVPTPLGD